MLEEKLADYEITIKNTDNHNGLNSNQKKVQKKNSIYDLSSDYEEDDESLNSNLNNKYFNPSTNTYNIETRTV